MEAGSLLAEHMEDRKPTQAQFEVGCPECVSEVGENKWSYPHRVNERQKNDSLQGPVVNGPVGPSRRADLLVRSSWRQ